MIKTIKNVMLSLLILLTALTHTGCQSMIEAQGKPVFYSSVFVFVVFIALGLAIAYKKYFKK